MKPRGSRACGLPPQLRLLITQFTKGDQRTAFSQATQNDARTAIAFARQPKTHILKSSGF